jgi:hypothetical protein
MISPILQIIIAIIIINIIIINPRTSLLQIIAATNHQCSSVIEHLQMIAATNLQCSSEVLLSPVNSGKTMNNKQKCMEIFTEKSIKH